MKNFDKKIFSIQSTTTLH